MNKIFFKFIYYVEIPFFILVDVDFSYVTDCLNQIESNMNPNIQDTL